MHVLQATQFLMVLQTSVLLMMVRSRKPMLRTLVFGYTRFSDACAAGISHPHACPAVAPSSALSANDAGDAPGIEGGGRVMPKKRGSSRGGVGGVPTTKRVDSFCWLQACSVSELQNNRQYRNQPKQEQKMHEDYPPVQFHLYDLHCLDPTEWLNSEVINSYLAIVQRQVRKGGVHILVSHFMAKLEESTDVQMKSWVRGVCNMNKVASIYLLDRLCMPMNISNRHWVAILCDFRTCQITLVDSLTGHDHSPALRRLKAFLESKTCAGNDKKDWNFCVLSDEKYRQRNGFDCGLFTIAHVTLFALKQESRLGVCTPEIVNNMRQRVYHDLIANEIKL